MEFCRADVVGLWLWLWLLRGGGQGVVYGGGLTCMEMSSRVSSRDYGIYDISGAES